MINYKAPYDSNEIRQGLMNIKQSQMQLLKQLKNQHHLLKKYTPDDPIYQQKSQSNVYQTSSQAYSHKQNMQNNSSHKKNPFYSPKSYLQRDFEENQKSVSALKNHNNSILEKQIQTVTQDFHRMKKNYFNEKQKNKDMVLHMEFAASLHNLILKDVLQGNNLENIKSKVRSQVLSYQSQFQQFKAFGLEQAFNIINLQSDSLYVESRNSSNRRTPIFPPKYQNSNQNAEFLKQLNDLKCELKEISLEKERKSELVTLMKSQNQYTISLLNKQVEMKNQKINELVSQLLKHRQSAKSISVQNNQLRTNMERLKSELQRNFNKIQSLQMCQKKTNETIENEHKYMKYLKQLEEKVSFYEKQTRQKTKIIQIHQQNLNKTNELFRAAKTQNQKHKKQLEEISNSHRIKVQNSNQLQQKIQKLKMSHLEQIKMVSKRNENQQNSLKIHIQELKRSIQQLLQQEESYKQSDNMLQEMKLHKMETLKLSKTIDHLWKIKEVQYENINQVLSQLNEIKNLNSQRQKNTNNNAGSVRQGSLKQKSRSKYKRRA